MCNGPMCMGHISYLSIVLPLLPEEQLGVNNMRLWKENLTQAQ
jgi:hypothetical protein